MWRVKHVAVYCRSSTVILLRHRRATGLPSSSLRLRQSLRGRCSVVAMGRRARSSVAPRLPLVPATTSIVTDRPRRLGSSMTASGLSLCSVDITTLLPRQCSMIFPLVGPTVTTEIEVSSNFHRRCLSDHDLPDMMTISLFVTPVSGWSFLRPLYRNHVAVDLLLVPSTGSTARRINQFDG